jgi:hypothetical protein
MPSRLASFIAQVLRPESPARRSKPAPLRIPTKRAMHSNLKPATYSDLKPAGVPI